MPVELTLPLLERRTYLHGTTLFSALVALVPGASEFVFKVSQQIESDRVRVYRGRQPAVDEPPSSASLAWMDRTGRDQMRVVAMPMTGSPTRDAYDESLVSSACTVSDRSVVLEGKSPFSFVATLIPMYKRLLAAQVPIAPPGQWMFTRLDLANLPPPGYRALRLSLDRVLGDNLARSRISVDEKDVGMIYFSWVR